MNNGKHHTDLNSTGLGAGTHFRMWIGSVETFVRNGTWVCVSTEEWPFIRVSMWDVPPAPDEGDADPPYSEGPFSAPKVP